MEIKNVFNPDNNQFLSRKSIRRYDRSVGIKREVMKNILQDAMTAPSSLNLQPWRFVVIDTAEGKGMIRPYMMFNQEQCDSSAAIIAIFGDYENFSYTEEVYSAAEEKGLLSPEKKQKMVEMITEYRKLFTDEKIKETFLFDCGLVAMQIMLSAKAYGYDTNPIGGYMKDEVTDILGLDKKRYFPVLLISIGKAAEEGYDSIRFSVDEITQWR